MHVLDSLASPTAILTTNTSDSKCGNHGGCWSAWLQKCRCKSSMSRVSTWPDLLCSRIVSIALIAGATTAGRATTHGGVALLWGLPTGSRTDLLSLPSYSLSTSSPTFLLLRQLADPMLDMESHCGMRAQPLEHLSLS